MEHVRKVKLWKKIGGAVLGKEAELTNTYDMPADPPPSQTEVRPTRKAVPAKTASATSEFNLEGAILDREEENPPLLHEEEPQKQPQMAPFKPTVDVSSQTPPVKVTEKKASWYALPEHELYPLDSYRQVKMAHQYFEENFKFIPPAERHTYCENLTKRASQLNIMTSPLVEKYGSATYAPMSDIQVCLEARKAVVQDPVHQGILDKLAHEVHNIEPELFAETLEQFDKVASIQHYYGADVPDAYYSTFGKVAAGGDQTQDTPPEESLVIGNEYITRRRLNKYFRNNVGSLSSRFGAEMAEELAKDKGSVFDSLPRDQKLVLMRMANNDDSPVTQAVATG